MKKITILCLCALMLALGMGLHAYLPVALAAEQADTEAPALSDSVRALLLESKLARIDAIAHRIIAREIIESPLLVYVEDEALLAQLNLYNTETARWSGYFHWRAQNALVFVFELPLTNADGEPTDHIYGLNYLNVDPRVIAMTAKVAKYCLYDNWIELCETDPDLGGVIASEAGGSYGMWHVWLHDMDDQSTQAELDAYLALDKALLPALEAYKLKLAAE